MRATLSKSFWIMAFVAFLGAFGYFAWNAEHVQRGSPPHQRQASGEQHHSQDESGKGLWDRTLEDPVAFFTACLAAVTVVLAVISTISIIYLVKADQTAASQARHMADSVAQAARFATAMENLATEAKKNTAAAFQLASAAEESARAAWGGSVATERTARIMENTAKRQLRAYVVAEIFGVNDFSPTKTAQFEIKIRNTGQTPAYSVAVFAAVEIFTHPLGKDFSIVAKDSDFRGSLVVNPGIAITHFQTCDRIFSVEEIATLWPEEGGNRLYIYGVIRYADAFGETRHTNFCAYIGGPDIREGLRAIMRGHTPGALTFRYTDSHNEAT